MSVISTLEGEDCNESVKRPDDSQHVSQHVLHLEEKDPGVVIHGEHHSVHQGGLCSQATLLLHTSERDLLVSLRLGHRVAREI